MPCRCWVATATPRSSPSSATCAKSRSCRSSRGPTRSSAWSSAATWRRASDLTDALGRTRGNGQEELGRTGVRDSCGTADESNVTSKATLDEISARLSEEFPGVLRGDVARAVLASWWMFERESDERLRARAAEWYARSALNALAERQPLERA